MGDQAGTRREPLVAITLGDPFGIGPELVVRMLSDAQRWARVHAVVLGDADVVRENVSRLGAPVAVSELATLADATFAPGTIEVLAPAGEPVGEIAWGRVDERAGRSSLAAFELAAALIAQKQIDALLSAPVNKQALRLAGMRQADELMFLGALTGSPAPTVVGVLESLLTVCATLHVPLRAVPDLITRESVIATTRLLLALLAPVHDRPRVAVAGLNPHAGDGGVLGREEIEQIAPALDQLRSEGCDVIGPLAPDTAFPQALALGAHGVACMYHDQANIARKLFGFRGATLFVGLPVPVATTAHGTAFDRAGAGVSDPSSLELAFEQLISMVGART